MNIITPFLCTALLALTIATASAQLTRIEPSSKVALPHNDNPTVEEAAAFEKSLKDEISQPITIILHQSNHGAKVTIPNGSLVKVILESQGGSTGFDWSPTCSSADTLTLEHEDTKLTPYPLPGAGEKETWIFKATAPGQTLLTFSLARSWEKEVSPLETIQFNITVQ